MPARTISDYFPVSHDRRGLLSYTAGCVLALLVLTAVSPNALAEDWLKKWPLQVHGFASQGFAISNRNNYLTMSTSRGAFDFTDGGVNVSVQVTDKLRVGAQAYVRNIGTLGGWRPILDWAIVDYKVKDWLSLRGGKGKTVFGLYNDSQDMESLHTWAILPQSVYALDLRSSSLAHLGGDIGGEIPMREGLGGIAYTVYAGRRFDDRRGGYRDVAAQNGVLLNRVTGWMAGGDLRWNNLRPGLTVGASYLVMPFEGVGKMKEYQLPVKFEVDSKTRVFYVDYLRGNLHLTGESIMGHGAAEVTGLPGVTKVDEPLTGWYASLSYRLSPHLELGGYHSRFISNTGQPWRDPDNHIYDQAITARVDVNRHWSVKLEGHFIDGHGSVFSARGFYRKQNPNGFEPKTNMFVLRTGYTF